MIITRNNYEAFLLDYFEGNLSPEKVDLLLFFLDQNPDLKEDFEDFEDFNLVPERQVFEDKLMLKRSAALVNGENYENYIIAEIEGENKLEESQELSLFLKANPSKQKEFTTYQKTKLIAPEIIFSDKQSLKKETKVIPLFWWYSSAAAVVLMFFLLKNVNNEQINKGLPIANTTETIKVDLSQGELETKSKELLENDEAEVLIVEPAISKETLVNHPIKKLQQRKKARLDVPKEEKQASVILANNVSIDSENVKDSSQNKIEEPINEPVLYAESVKIVYEEEEVNKEPKVKQKKQSKIGRFLTKSLVERNILRQRKNEENEVVAYALTFGKLGFSRNKKKNKN